MSLDCLLQFRFECKVLLACQGRSYAIPASFQYIVNRPQPDWLSEFGILFEAKSFENHVKLILVTRKRAGR